MFNLFKKKEDKEICFYVLDKHRLSVVRSGNDFIVTASNDNGMFFKQTLNYENEAIRLFEILCDNILKKKEKDNA